MHALNHGRGHGWKTSGNNKTFTANIKAFTVESCQFDHRPGRNNKVVALMQEYPTEPLYKIPARQAEFEVFNVTE